MIYMFFRGVCQLLGDTKMKYVCLGTCFCSSFRHAHLIIFAVQAPALLPSSACLGPAF